MRLFFILFAITFFLSSCDQNNSYTTITGIATEFDRRSSPVINEIMFEPLQNSGDGIADQPDFVEIYNPGPETVDVEGWYIQDCPTASGRRYSYHFAQDPGKDNFLAPGQYAIIVPEESPDPTGSRLTGYYDYLSEDHSVRIFIVERKTFSFNNDTDCIVLKDKSDAVVDSVFYDRSWHNPYVKSTKGFSIEKYNDQLASASPSSWSTSSNGRYGATPGKRNSVYLSEDDMHRSPSVSADPGEFSPDMQGSGETTCITWRLPAGAYQIALTIYDSEGAIVRKLAEGLPAGPTGAIAWDGLDDDRRPALSGIYLVRLSVAGDTFDGTGELEENVVLVR